jgi:hypothetical protein
MTDCEYLFQQTSKERKELARNAKYKKNGSKSKKCTLPSDYLSKKEINKMSGEPITWNMNHFYSYDVFKSMPSDIQVEYINRICEKYQVGINTISRVMFNLANTTLRMYLDSHGLMQKIKKNSAHGHGCKKGELHLRYAMEKESTESSKESAFDNMKFEEGIQPILEGLESFPNCQVFTPRKQTLPSIQESDVKKLQQRRRSASLSISSLTLELNKFDIEVIKDLEKQFSGQKIKMTIKIEVMDK